MTTANSASLTYYEQRALEFISQPFKRGEEKVFNISSGEWSDYCDTKLAERRQNYHCGDKFLTMGEIAQKSILTREIQKVKGSPLKIYLIKDDITQLEIDAIVNAANETLLGGGGVDEAIHNGAGPLLVRECAFLGGCEVGEAKVTKGYDLPAKHVIHTVGPILPQNPDLLGKCYKSSLKKTKKMGLSAIAFPCISCGFYGFPIEDAAKIAIASAINFIQKKKLPKLDAIIFCVFNSVQQEAYEKALSIN